MVEMRQISRASVEVNNTLYMYISTCKKLCDYANPEKRDIRQFQFFLAQEGKGSDSDRDRQNAQTDTATTLIIGSVRHRGDPLEARQVRGECHEAQGTAQERTAILGKNMYSTNRLWGNWI